MLKRGRRVLKWLAIGVGLVIIVVALRGRLPAPGQVAESLAVADLGWLVVALAAELASMAMFARQQRRLLTAFGVTMPRHRALALAYSRSAISITIAVLLLIGFLAWPTAHTFPAPRRRGGRLARLTARAPRFAALITPVLDAVRSSRSVARRDWALALAAATANWLTDLLCLAAAARAFHLPLSLVELAAVYLTVQIVRQVPITPGGIGVIEMSLLAGLISAGAGEAP